MVSDVQFVSLARQTERPLSRSPYASRSKTPFKSLIIGAVIVLLPTVRPDIFASRVVQKILMFLPTDILIGVHHFKTFEAFYLFGKVIMLPSAGMVVAAVLSTLMVIGAYFSFRQHQVENQS